MTMVVIRRATAVDQPNIVGMILPIQGQEFGIPITAEQQPDLGDIDGFYRRPGGEFWLAEDAGRIVGTIAAMYVEENTAAIRKMFVAAEQRGTGLAARLMDTLVEWARAAGFPTLLLGTTDVMHAAHRFYAANGFFPIEIEQLPSSFPRMAVDSVFYRRDLPGVVAIRDPNPRWPEMFDERRQSIEAALSHLHIAVHHTGSTSVPELPAKPVIDITMTVPDTTDEHSYVPALETIGYRFLVREPDWFEHRLLAHDFPRVNLHVFSTGCSEVDAMLALRDWLRTNDADRELYATTKRRLAAQRWETVQDYADAKTEVIGDIMGRAQRPCNDVPSRVTKTP